MKQLKYHPNKGQRTTINIGHLADSANLSMLTFYKIYCGLIGWCFKMPNVPYSDRYLQGKNDNYELMKTF